MAEPIVSIGFLTQHDLNILGQGFNRHFPVGEDHPFTDLVARLDELTFDKEQICRSSALASPSHKE